MPKTTVINTPPCPGCKRIATLVVDTEALKNWRNGMLIQRAFPKMSIADREALITGYCDDCWERLIVDPVEEALQNVERTKK
jgi:hypothetical protein